MTPDEKSEMEKLVKDAASKLAEHVDTVRIFVTRRSEDGDGLTSSYTFGIGNIFAQRGQIDYWLEDVRELDRCESRDRYRKDNGDE